MTPTFDGLRVLTLESRRANELAALISTYGGRPIVAPALREVPLESNAEAVAFAGELVAGQFDVVMLLTGVGARVLADVGARALPPGVFLDALRRTKVVARGPKPMAILRELQVPVWINAPEPNTWREILAEMDARTDELAMEGARIAVQEYGVSNVDLLEGLQQRGAHVTRVHVYQWALPEDLEPLRHAVRAVCRGEIDVVIVTSGVQMVHLWQIAVEMQVENELRENLRRAVLASIGPSASEELRRRGLAADLEPSHPKMGILVRETADQAAMLIQSKRS